MLVIERRKKMSITGISYSVSKEKTYIWNNEIVSKKEFERRLKEIDKNWQKGKQVSK